MKTITKLFGVMVAVLLCTLSMVSCSSDDDPVDDDSVLKGKVVGTWIYESADITNSQLGEEATITSVDLCWMKLNSDGSLSYTKYKYGDDYNPEDWTNLEDPVSDIYYGTYKVENGKITFYTYGESQEFNIDKADGTVMILSAHIEGVYDITIKLVHPTEDFPFL